MGITKRFNGTQLEQELTKPCPLMPDGEWYQATLHIYYEDDELKYDRVYSSDDCPFDISVNFTESICNASVLMKDSYAQSCKLAECRMTVETSGTVLNVMPMQSNYAWRVDTDTGKQRYYLFYYGSNPFSYYIADGDTYCDVYVYVVPTEHQEDGDA